MSNPKDHQSSPSKKRNSSEDSNGSVSSTEIDFSKHVPIYKQFDIYGKRIAQVEDDPVTSRASSRIGKAGNSSSKRKKQEDLPEYKNNFISAFFDQAEDLIVQEQQQIMRDKLTVKLNQAQSQRAAPKGILKKPQVDASSITQGNNLPQNKSKGFWAQIPMGPSDEQEQIREVQRLTEEQEEKQIQDKITEGVQKARESMNAPTLDLLEFEKQLKAKHDEFQAAGVKPKLRVNFQGQVIKKKQQK